MIILYFHDIKSDFNIIISFRYTKYLVCAANFLRLTRIQLYFEISTLKRHPRNKKTARHSACKGIRGEKRNKEPDVHITGRVRAGKTGQSLSIGYATGVRRQTPLRRVRGPRITKFRLSESFLAGPAPKSITRRALSHVSLLSLAGYRVLSCPQTRFARATLRFKF